jgi:hypothetical protein
MEDQRNFCDSSYKAFSGMALTYPNVAKGEAGKQTLTIRVNVPEGWQPEPLAAAPVAVTVGEPIAGARIPLLTPEASRGESQNFMHYNNKPDQFTNAEWIVMAFNPAAHMPDDDTFMENIPAVLDQVHSIRGFAPRAKFRIEPITIDSPYPRPGPDPRNRGQFAAAWCARMLKYLALAGVDEAVFKVGPGPCDDLLADAARLKGQPILATDVDPHGRVDVLATEDALWLINKTDAPQQVTVTRGTSGGVRPESLAPLEVKRIARENR